MTAKPVVFVVDHDPVVLRSLERLIRPMGLPVRRFASAESFLTVYDPGQPGCLLLDVPVPGMVGAEVQRVLAGRRSDLPVVVISRQGDVAAAVRAMKMGAVDFLQKPFDDAALLSALRTALRRDAQTRRQTARRTALERRLAKLTLRERQVMNRLVAGQRSKQIAAEFGVTPQAIDAHRSRLLAKMQADNVIELTRRLGSCGLLPQRVVVRSRCGR